MNPHRAALAASIAMLTALAPAAADHLLISEVMMNAPGNGTTENNDITAEFVEIYNPTNQPVELKNYFVTDYPKYHTLPAGSFNFATEDTSDYMLRFPTSAILGPGQIAVVISDADTYFDEVGSGFGSTAAGFAALAGGPILFEISDTDSEVPQMINLKTGATAEGTFAKINSGEFVALIYWNGETDLVSDVDIVRWGAISGGNNLFNKSGLAIDGPDAGTEPSTYATDARPDHFNFIILPQALIRKVANETFEIQTGGNGITGHDETTENLRSDFDGVTNTNVTPGLLHPDLLPTSVDDWSVY